MYAHILQAHKHTWPLTAGLLQGWAGKKPPELPPAGGNETEQSPSCSSSLDSVICSQILILALPPHSPDTRSMDLNQPYKASKRDISQAEGKQGGTRLTGLWRFGRKKCLYEHWHIKNLISLHLDPCGI